MLKIRQSEPGRPVFRKELDHREFLTDTCLLTVTGFYLQYILLSHDKWTCEK